jgi:hypothetical protein
MTSLRSCALVLLFAAACSSSKPKQEQRSPELEAKYRAAIARGEATFGMRRDEVERAIGKPQRKDWTTVDGEKRERWAYAFSEVHFDREGYVVRLVTP